MLLACTVTHNKSIWVEKNEEIDFKISKNSKICDCLLKFLFPLLSLFLAEKKLFFFTKPLAYNGKRGYVKKKKWNEERREKKKEEKNSWTFPITMTILMEMGVMKKLHKDIKVNKFIYLLLFLFFFFFFSITAQKVRGVAVVWPCTRKNRHQSCEQQRSNKNVEHL